MSYESWHIWNAFNCLQQVNSFHEQLSRMTDHAMANAAWRKILCAYFSQFKAKSQKLWNLCSSKIWCLINIDNFMGCGSHNQNSPEHCYSCHGLVGVAHRKDSMDHSYAYQALRSVVWLTWLEQRGSGSQRLPPKASGSWSGAMNFCSCSFQSPEKRGDGNSTREPLQEREK